MAVKFWEIRNILVRNQSFSEKNIDEFIDKVGEFLYDDSFLMFQGKNFSEKNIKHFLKICNRRLSLYRYVKLPRYMIDEAINNGRDLPELFEGQNITPDDREKVRELFENNYGDYGIFEDARMYIEEMFNSFIERQEEGEYDVPIFNIFNDLMKTYYGDYIDYADRIYDYVENQDIMTSVFKRYNSEMYDIDVEKITNDTKLIGRCAETILDCLMDDDIDIYDRLYEDTNIYDSFYIDLDEYIKGVVKFMIDEIIQNSEYD